MAQQYPKRLIEVDLPIRRISEHSRREKSIRHGHISTLHIWWARRPLAACRAVICAALWPDPADDLCPESFREAARHWMKKWATEHLGKLSPESYARFIALQKNPEKLSDNTELRSALLDFIADFANWDNSTVKEYLDTSRALTQAAHEALGGTSDTRPLVVDPFAGGGSIPLEALRVGADAFASDLNPVPVLLNKVVLEYIPKYGQRLADEVRKWGEWIKREAEKELAEFYPKDADGATPIAYLWARTIRCEGPGCGVEVPLIRSPVLATRGGKSVSLISRGDAKNKRVLVEISLDGTNKGEPTVRRGSVTCPLCGYTTPASNSRKQFLGRSGGTQDARLLCVITTRKGVAGKTYRKPTAADIRAFEKAVTAWRKLKGQVTPENLPVIPDEALPYLRSIFNINLLGVTEWGQLHNPRQAVALAVLSKLIRDTWGKLSSLPEQELAQAIHLCLGLALDRSADRMTSLCRWIHQNEAVGFTFGRQALGIVWDYVEIDPTTTEAAWQGVIESISEVISSNALASLRAGTSIESSSTKHPLPSDSAACFVTDPPYYDAVPYADLSDFFFVWLKRTVSTSHPRFSRAILTPKEDEVVQLSERNPIYAFKTRERFEKLMMEAMSEGRRVLTPAGIGVVVFAHKTTAGWETQLKAMIDAGWIITGSWPIDTEKPGRLRALDAAALASSIHLVCRPRENTDGSVRTDEVGDWRDVQQELPRRIHEWMPRLAEEGVVGADAIFACLGPALEIFSRYARVEKASGEQVPLREYLEVVWATVAKEALNMIFAGADATGFEEDARLTAMWLWTLSAGNTNGIERDTDEEESGDEDEESSGKFAKIKGFVLEYDAARKIAQGLGAHLEDLTTVVEVKGDKARLLPVAERGQHLFGKEESAAADKRKKKQAQLDIFGLTEEENKTQAGAGTKVTFKAGETTLDRIHQSMILFAAGRGEALKRFLVEDGAGRDQRFWRLAQALSALYPSSSEEKRWVDGVLARKKGLGL